MSAKSSGESQLEREQENAAWEAVRQIQDGMVVGLGSGRTAARAIRALGERVSQGLRIRGIPTSEASRQLAVQVGIPLTQLDQDPRIDLTFDGADRFDSRLNLIKGGGGALLREKIVAAASQRLIIMADSSKRADPLGGFPIPVEVIPFGYQPVMNRFTERGWRPKLRVRDDNVGSPVITDESNYIIDLQLDVVDDPEGLASALIYPGVVEHGLFLQMADEVLFGQGDRVERLQRA